MANVQVAHNPQLTREMAFELFRQAFHGRYEIRTTPVINRDFVVRKSATTGVFVKLVQKPGRTEFLVRRGSPSAIARIVLGLGLGSLVLGRDVEADVVRFLQTAPQLAAGQTAPPQPAYAGGLMGTYQPSTAPPGIGAVPLPPVPQPAPRPRRGGGLAITGGVLMMLSAIVLGMSLILPVITGGKTTWEEALMGIIPGAAVFVLATPLLVVGLLLRRR